MNGLFGDAVRNATNAQILILAGGVMFSSFAVAYVVALAFPPVDGKPRRISLVVARVCLIFLILSALWFIYTANESRVLVERAFPTRPMSSF